MVTVYIPDAGGCVVSKRIMERTAQLKWMVREDPVEAEDNGWRFLSADDDDAYLEDPDNLMVVDFNEVADIEPAVLPVLNLPVGSSLELVVEAGMRSVIDTATEEKLY